MDAQSLYFIAVVPAEKIKRQVTNLKNVLAEQFHSRHGLKSPPHITLIPPFNLTRELEKRLSTKLSDFNRENKPFNVIIDGFGAFKPHVLYLNIIENEKLDLYQKKLNDHLYNHMKIGKNSKKPFTPHMTLAFRDLKTPMFYKAWKIFKHEKFQASFEVNSIFLLRHNGKIWDIVSEYSLAEKSPV